MQMNRIEGYRKASSSVLRGALCGALLLACAGSNVRAQTQQAKATPVSQVGTPAVMQSSRTEINIGGEVVMRLIGEAGRTAEQRADIIRERLIPILALENLRAEDIVLRPGPDMSYASIYVRDRLLVTVTQGLAKANKTTPEALAAIYAERFRRILPQISSSDYDPYTDLLGRAP